VRARADWPQFAFGAAIVLGAAAMGLVALAVPPRAQDILLGPRLFPLLVMGGLMLLGAGLMLAAWRGTKARSTAPPPPIDDWRGVGLVAVALLLFAVLVETLGFIVAEAALFAVTASAFGSRRRLRDAGTGLALAGTAYVVFKFGLGLNLPTGGVTAYVLAKMGAG
jgi:putative tricarboxylic transport membrane protein